jgi:divalent metal cation (Fe/Co/Zn/Cd) transporter
MEESNILKKYSTLTEATLIGASIGAIAGLYFGYKRGGTIWLTTLSGFVVGGLITSIGVDITSKN